MGLQMMGAQTQILSTQNAVEGASAGSVASALTGVPSGSSDAAVPEAVTTTTHATMKTPQRKPLTEDRMAHGANVVA